MINNLQVLGTVKNALVVWMGIIFLAELVTPVQVMQHVPSLLDYLWPSSTILPRRVSC